MGNLSEKQKEGILTMDDKLREIVTDLQMNEAYKILMDILEQNDTTVAQTTLYGEEFVLRVDHAFGNNIIVYLKPSVFNKYDTTKINPNLNGINVWDMIMKIALTIEDRDIYHRPDGLNECIIFSTEKHTVKATHALTFFDLYGMRNHRRRIEENLKNKS